MNKRTPVYFLDCSDEHLLEGFELWCVFFSVQNVKSVMERFLSLIARSKPQSILRDVIRRFGMVDFRPHTILVSHRSVILVEPPCSDDEVLWKLTLVSALRRLLDIELEGNGGDEVAWDSPGIVDVIVGSHRYRELWLSTGLSGFVLPPAAGPHSRGVNA